MDADKGRPGLRFHRDTQSAGKTPQQHERDFEPVSPELGRCGRSRRTLPVRCTLFKRSSATEEPGSRRNNYRSNCRVTDRPDHSASIAGTCDRRSEPELRWWFWMRLRQHDFMADSHGSATHGKQPTSGIRKIVW